MDSEFTKELKRRNQDMYDHMDGGLGSYWRYGDTQKCSNKAFDMYRIYESIQSLVRFHANAAQPGKFNKVRFKLLTEEDSKQAGFLGSCAKNGTIAFSITPYEELDDKHKIRDTYAGVALHEVSHWLNTDFEVMDRRMPEFKSNLGPMVFQLFEDEFIEQDVREVSPGYRGYIGATKKYCAETQNMTVEEILSKAKGGEEKNVSEEVARTFKILFNYLRLPECSEAWEESFEINGINVKDFLDKNVRFSTGTEDSIEQALAIEKFFIEDCKIPVKKINGTIGQIAVILGEEGEVSEHLSELFEDYTNSESVKDLETRPQDKLTNKKNLLYIEKKINRSRYNAAKKRVSSHINAMREALSVRVGTKVRKLSGQMEGHLDRRALHRANYSPRIFYNKDVELFEGFSLGILLDESGSMNSSDKQNRARELAVMVQEAVCKIKGIELEVYSFSSRNNREDGYVRVLYGAKQRDKFGIGTYQANSENYDHAAIRDAGKFFLANTTKSNRLFIVVSDGMPCGTGYGGRSANQATKHEVDKLRKSVPVFAVDIEGVHCEEIYGKDNVYKFTDHAKLPKQFRQLIMKLGFKS